MVSNASIATLYRPVMSAPAQRPAARHGRRSRNLRSGFDTWLMTAGIEKSHQPRPRDGRRHGVDERMIVQNLVGQHSPVENYHNFAGNVIDCGERGDRAGAN